MDSIRLDGWTGLIRRSFRVQAIWVFLKKTTLDLNPTILAYQTKLVIWCHFSTMFRFAGNQPLPSDVLLFLPLGCWLGICELATKHLNSSLIRIGYSLRIQTPP